jgi:predicted TIM-barrel fold metal-dependent hydrolase
MMSNLAMPQELLPFAGRITDVDSHEQMPAQVWTDVFGEVARPFAELMMKSKPTNPNHANVADYAGDLKDIDPETLWRQKGPTSPGAVDIARRLEVMDLMGVKSQLMFPTSIGLWGFALYTATPDMPLWQLFKEESKTYAEKLWAANNEWAIGAAKISPRIRPVAPLYGDTLPELMRVTEHLLESGIRAVSLVGARLPAGLSPAHTDLDPFYAMLAEAKVPLLLHIGGESGFLSTVGWGKAPAFEGYKINEEVSMDPWWLSVVHLAPQNFLATMVNGGVFHRHPELRFGVAEYGAHWVGPLADMLDIWYDNNQSIGIKDWGDEHLGRKMPMRPSEYIARNVKVSPFDFEKVDEYIDRFGLAEVYAFASDYPHVEGGSDPLGRLTQRLKRKGSGVLEKFFVSNGEWMLPD